MSLTVCQFEEAHKNLIKDLNFSNGELVLVRNSQRDGNISGKTKPRYFGPMIVVWRLKGDSYVLAEMDRSWSKLRFAAFQLVPYHARDRRSIPLTRLINENIEELIDKTHEPDKFPEKVHDNSRRSNWWGYQYQNYPLVVEIRCLPTSQTPSTSTLLHYSSDNNTPSIVFIFIYSLIKLFFFCYLIWLFFVYCLSDVLLYY